MARRPARANLEEVTAKSRAEPQGRECRFLAQHAGAQGTLEPVAQRGIRRRFQSPLLLENTSEVLMLQVKYAAKCQSLPCILTCARWARSPITMSGSSSLPRRRLR